MQAFTVPKFWNLFRCFLKRLFFVGFEFIFKRILIIETTAPDDVGISTQLTQSDKYLKLDLNHLRHSIVATIKIIDKCPVEF